MSEVQTENTAGIPNTGIPTHDKNGRALSELERRRLYEKRLDEAYKMDANRKSAPFKAMLFALYDEATAMVMWQQIEPIVTAGKEGVRREIGRNRRSAVTPVAA